MSRCAEKGPDRAPGDLTGGVRVAAVDANSDGVADIVTGAGPGGGPLVLVVDGTKLSQLWPTGQVADSALLSNFFPFVLAFTGGGA